MSFTITGPVTQIDYDAGELMTEQAHKQEADINFIVDQFTRTGVLLHNKEYEGTYGDFITGDIYEIAQNALAEANNMYESLPQNIRQQFPEGTAQFLDFIQDSANIEQMEALGLSTDHLEQVSTQPVPPAAPEQSTSEAATQALEGFTNHVDES